MFYEISLLRTLQDCNCCKSGEFPGRCAVSKGPICVVLCLLFLCAYRHSLQSIRKYCFMCSHVYPSACAWPDLHPLRAPEPSFYIDVWKYGDKLTGSYELKPYCPMIKYALCKTMKYHRLVHYKPLSSCGHRYAKYSQFPFLAVFADNLTWWNSLCIPQPVSRI